MILLPSRQSYKYILHMALPAIAGLSTQMVVSLVDTAMVGRLPDAEYSLAAMGLGVLATWALIAFFSSFATGTHVLIARNYGGKEYNACGDVLKTSIIMAVVIGSIVGYSVVFTSYQISDFFAVDDLVGIYAGDYLHYRFMGIPFFLITVSYRGFFFGIGKTKIFMYSGILANFLNIVFNYFFIFGAFGFEGMGLAGAGLGSTLATVCDAIFYFTISMLPSYRRKFELFKNFRFVKDYAMSILKISLPVSFQNVFILIGFLVFISITGYIGTAAQAASQVVISSLMITLMPCNGFGIAAQTLVGNAIGADKINQAKYYGFETSKLATIYTLSVGFLFIVLPELILILITNDQQVINAAIPALRIGGFGQIFYGVAVVLANALQSAGRSLFVMMTDVIIIWLIFVPLSFLLGVVLEFGLIGAWVALPFYVILYSSVMFLKFKYGHWKRIKRV